MTGSNGRLAASALSPIGGGLFLERETAVSYLAMRSHISSKTGHLLSLNAAYRTYAKQVYLYNGYTSGQPGFNLAANPGTSNHGWGLAIDLASQTDRHYIDLLGSPFGWAKRWSDAQVEWWHIKINTPVWQQNKSQLVNPFAVMLPDEQRWLREYLSLRSSGGGAAERRKLWRALKGRRQEIWRSAQKGGWNVQNRRQRYDLIRQYIGG